MESYGVGDILWIVGNTRPGVQAVRITEELTKKTLQGTQTSYMVESTRSSKTSFPLEKLEGKIFKNLDEAKNHMMQSAEAAIDAMIKNNQNIINKNWLQVQPNEKELNQEQKVEDGYTYITLENGQRARIKLPSKI